MPNSHCRPPCPTPGTPEIVQRELAQQEMEYTSPDAIRMISRSQTDRWGCHFGTRYISITVCLRQHHPHRMARIIARCSGRGKAVVEAWKPRNGGGTDGGAERVPKASGISGCAPQSREPGVLETGVWALTSSIPVEPRVAAGAVAHRGQEDEDEGRIERRRGGGDGDRLCGDQCSAARRPGGRAGASGGGARAGIGDGAGRKAK